MKVNVEVEMAGEIKQGSASDSNNWWYIYIYVLEAKVGRYGWENQSYFEGGIDRSGKQSVSQKVKKGYGMR